MTIKKAVDHFVFKLSNVWKATDKDAQAINAIMQFVEEKSKQQYQDYHLFAKLYIMVYSQYLKKYKATVFDDIPTKELTKYLETPLQHVIETFVQTLNESELYTVFDLSGRKDFDLVHITHIQSMYKEMGYKSDEVSVKVESVLNARKTRSDKLSDILEDFPEVKDYLYKGKDIWDYETVKDNLEAQINNTINLLN